MKSQFSEKFNHDPIAVGYDENVTNENNPIRKGYSDVMRWVTDMTDGSNVLVDLGCGTGNTAQRVKDYERMYCVDISWNMLDIAKKKLEGKNIEFKESDLLGFFDDLGRNEDIDTVMSTYAIHHLTQEEKHILFEKIYGCLPQWGCIVFADLMFKNRAYEESMKKKYPDLVEDFEDELYWNVDDEVKKLESIGFRVRVSQFSDLSWGVYGER